MASENSGCGHGDRGPATPATIKSSEWTNRMHDALNNISHACKNGNLEVIKNIFGKFFSTDRRPRSRQLKGWLRMAVKYGHADIALFLLNSGARMDPELVDVAARITNKQVMFVVFEVLFAKGLDLLSCPRILYDHRIITNIPLLEYLLTKGADPNNVTSSGTTPLNKCSSCAATEVFMYYGANANHANLLHKQVWERADEDFIKGMEFVLENMGIDINARFVHCPCPHPCSNYLHKRASTDQGGTALHFAVRGYCLNSKICSLSRVKWLLDHDVDRDIRDDEGLKAVDYATNQEMSDLLAGSKFPGGETVV
ncbi:hypothetical protein G7Y89_g2069 [Cudoniella acicularis]|uniref:Uncharacterized protein n=1 Tax=Cudoniella acicularis TaxID=354080 RepID=A0A8H4RVU7_9HELO|nr:hypothetical protein G7Y89_g2069 [Cudoniella acicularis]